MDMLSVKRVSLAGVATGAMITAVAGTAVAQSGDYYSRNKYEAVSERRQPQYDPEPIRLGAFLVNSNLNASVAYTNNALGTSSNEESDVIARIGADVSARTNWNVHEIGLDVSAARDEYQDFSKRSANDISARLRGRLDVTRELSLGAAAFVQERADQVSDPSNVAGLLKPIVYTRTGAEVSANYTNDRVRWRNTASVSETDYDDAQTADGVTLDQDFRDNTTTQFYSRLSYAISPNVAVYGQGSVNERDYDNEVVIDGLPRSRDSKGYTVSVGTDFELSTLVRGDVSVGYLNEEKDDPFFDDVSGLAVDARVQWFPSRLTTVTFTGGRRSEDSGIRNAPSSVRSNLGARVDHELYRNVILSAEADYSTYDFEEVDRSDDVIDLGLMGTYKMNKRVHLNAFYRHVDRDRSGTFFAGDESFTADVIGLGIRLYP
ncbi:MAG: hypothetical protein CMF04_14755 [Hyphomonas sp.]|nr:hypothetical protein [Hyphomonas sp.]|tara:strand:+ start:35 stop:1333 length:1299 start_codon:yes stop_codon:yes gene_type:complete